MLSLAADLDGKCGVDFNTGESIMIYSKFLKPIMRNYSPLARARAHDNETITVNHPADKT
jgi:hypothetical protein